MDYIIENFEIFLENLVNIAILMFEFVGVCVIIGSGIKNLIKLLKKDDDIKMSLAKGLSMGLEFKLGSEILRTVLVRQWTEIGIVAGIIALRAGLMLLIHWEIKQEEVIKDVQEEDEKLRINKENEDGFKRKNQ